MSWGENVTFPYALIGTEVSSWQGIPLWASTRLQRDARWGHLPAARPWEFLIGPACLLPILFFTIQENQCKLLKYWNSTFSFRCQLSPWSAHVGNMHQVVKGTVGTVLAHQPSEHCWISGRLSWNGGWVRREVDSLIGKLWRVGPRPLGYLMRFYKRLWSCIYITNEEQGCPWALFLRGGLGQEHGGPQSQSEGWTHCCCFFHRHWKVWMSTALATYCMKWLMDDHQTRCLWTPSLLPRPWLWVSMGLGRVF